MLFSSNQPSFRLDEPVMNIASKEIVSIKEDSTCADVVRVMLDRYRRIPVISAGGLFKGFITASDMLDMLGAGPKFREVKSLKSEAIRMASKSPSLEKKATIGQAIELFQKHGRGAYPVVDGKKLIGIVSEWDIAKLVTQKTGIKVEQVMRKPMIARDSWSIFDAAKAMVRGGYRRIPVVHNKLIAGIVAPKDILKWLNENKALGKLKEANQPLGSIMVKDVARIGPKADLSEAVQMMKRAGVGGLPVANDEVLVGMITERDIVDCIS